MTFNQVFETPKMNLRNEEGNSKDNARKQWSDWLNEEYYRAARAART